MNHGVPQGSILGPLLFSIYINDLHTCIRNSTTFHFADDTNLLYIPNKKRFGNRCVRKINNDLKCLTQWLLANKISLNVTKTEIIFFRKKSLIMPECIKKIKLDGKKLRPSSEIKYLGILLDENLTFGPQIQKINAQLNRANTLLAKARHYMPRNLLMQLYYGQFFSRISYACQIWGQCLNEKSQTFLLQKKAIRIITFSDFAAHTSPLFKTLNIVKLPDLIKMQNLLFIHNVMNDKVPSYFHDCVHKIKSGHHYNTVNHPRSTHSKPAGSVICKNDTGKQDLTIKAICSSTCIGENCHAVKMEVDFFC